MLLAQAQLKIIEFTQVEGGTSGWCPPTGRYQGCAKYKIDTDMSVKGGKLGARILISQ